MMHVLRNKRAIYYDLNRNHNPPSKRRDVVIDMIFTIQEECRLSCACIHRAVELNDIVVAMWSYDAHDEFISLVCLLIASKHDEEKSLTLTDVAFLARRFANQEVDVTLVRTRERRVLDDINYMTNFTSTHEWLFLFAQHLNVTEGMFLQLEANLKETARLVFPVDSASVAMAMLIVEASYAIDYHELHRLVTLLGLTTWPAQRLLLQHRKNKGVKRKMS